MDKHDHWPLPFEPSTEFSLVREMGAYEALWARKEKRATFKRIAELHRGHPGCLPSSFVSPGEADEFGQLAQNLLAKADIDQDQFGISLYGVTGENPYPERLREAAYPVELLYFRGQWDLAMTRSVAVVGTRKPSLEGEKRAGRLVKELVNDEFTIVSGLAAGIDTVAHTTAISLGGRTIAVLGTPISEVYPKANARLQEHIAVEHLLISQVPICRYAQQDYRSNRYFFPERNVTMSALTEATVIVEAGETSGTLVQARAAFQQRRKLFILESCFHKNLGWPDRLVDKGAIRVADYEEIRRNLDLEATEDRRDHASGSLPFGTER